MVDFNSEIKKTQPINIKEMELNRYRIDADIKKSIVLYNIAIGEIRKGNLDLAVNDLKKSLSYNKGFSEAIKLMGLCYINMKEYKNAKKIFKKLEKYTIYNDLAYEYIDSLKIKKSMSKGMGTLDNGGYVANNMGKQYSAVKIIMSLLLMVIAIGGISINYFYPQTMQGVLAKAPISIQGAFDKLHSNNKIVATEEKADKSPEEERNLSVDNAISNEDAQSVKENLEDTKAQVDINKNKTDNLNMLSEAEKSIKEGNYENAASTLISMKSTNLDSDTKTKFDNLWQDVKTRGIWPIYNDGNKLYKQKNYGAALPKLKIASEIDPNLYLMPWITYQIGTCYKETNDKANALVYFKQVKDNYPKSNYVSNAQMMINEIGS